MRNVYPLAASSIDRIITEPRYLIQLELDTVINLSTHDELSIDGISWVQGNVQFINASDTAAVLRIYNTDYKYTQGAVRGSFHMNPVTIYAAYPRPDEWEPYIDDPDYVDTVYFVYTDVVAFFEIFSGRIAEITEIGEWLTIRCEKNETTRYPKVKLRSPLANHLPAPGALIQWQGETYRIDA
jgi:hypothetical protein